MALASRLRSTLSPGNTQLRPDSETQSRDATAAGFIQARVLKERRV